MENLSNKYFLRITLKEMRNLLTLQRREEATCSLTTQLLPTLSHYPSILSFVSFGSEINTSSLNHALASEKRLLLPKMEGNSLKIFRVNDLKTELIVNAYGIYEPNPGLCEEVAIRGISVVLVPALGFDQRHHRLGYGKGCYDRFLALVPHTLTIGIGFKEQLIEQLPIDHTDIPLEKVSLF